MARRAVRKPAHRRQPGAPFDAQSRCRPAAGARQYSQQVYCGALRGSAGARGRGAGQSRTAAHRPTASTSSSTPSPTARPRASSSPTTDRTSTTNYAAGARRHLLAGQACRLSPRHRRRSGGARQGRHRHARADRDRDRRTTTACWPAQRKLANAQQSLAEAEQFLDITQKQEAGRRSGPCRRREGADPGAAAPHRICRTRELDQEKARIAFGVLLFPNYGQAYTVIDDLEPSAAAAAVPRSSDAGFHATIPNIRAAQASLEQQTYELNSARAALYPIALLRLLLRHQRQPVALHNPEGHRLLGSVAQAQLTIPVWTWGATRSKIRQAECACNRPNRSELHAAPAAVEPAMRSTPRRRCDARNSHRCRRTVTCPRKACGSRVLRYQAGEATALEVVDAQITLRRRATRYADGLCAIGWPRQPADSHGGILSHMNEAPPACSSPLPASRAAAACSKSRSEAEAEARRAGAGDGRATQDTIHRIVEAATPRCFRIDQCERHAQDQRAGAEVLCQPRRSREGRAAAGTSRKSRPGWPRPRQAKAQLDQAASQPAQHRAAPQFPKPW